MFSSTTSLIALILVLFGFFASDQAVAQVDPSSALLLRSSGRPPQKEELSSRRYQVRPGASSKTSDSRPPQSTQRLQLPTNKAESPATSQAPGRGRNKKDVVQGEEVVIEASAASNDIRKSLSKDNYQRNLIDLHIAPVYVYNQSSSNYWYRQYLQNSNGFQIAADVWFTPEFGVRTHYMTTSGSSIDGSVSDDGRVSTENDWFTGELLFRNSLSGTSQGKAIIVGLGYSEYEMKVSSVADERIGVKSNGLRLRAEAILPSSSSHQWSLGVEYMPRLDHTEASSQITVKSGSDNESSQIGVHLGGRFLLSRRHQLFWRLDHKIERNLFSGTSNLNDPRSDLAPISGVEVTNTFTIFSLGYTWGH